MTTMPGPTVREVLVFGATYAVRTSGPVGATAGVPALLLPGLLFTARHLTPLGASLADDRVVLSVDLKGLGDSRGSGPYDPQTLAQEIAAVVREVVGDTRVDVVGEDWGGLVALALAHHHPEVIGRLVLVGAPTSGADALRMLSAGLLPAVLPDGVVRHLGGQAVRALLRAGWSDGSPPADIVDLVVAESADRLPVLGGYVRAVTGPHLARRMQALLSTRGGSTSRLPRPAASLVVHGEQDAMLRLSLARRNAAALGADLVVVPDAGHWPLVQTPGPVIPAIADFLHCSDSSLRHSGSPLRHGHSAPRSGER